MPRILVIGSSNTDMVIKTERFPQPGETILGGEFFMFSGGKGANQAVAAARMGANVTLLCKLGNDMLGQRALEELKKDGINTSFIDSCSTMASGTALILLDEKGENQIVVAPGANQALNELDIERAHEALQKADVVLMQLETPLPAMVFAARKAFAMGKKIILNPAPAQALPAELFKYLYLITPNQTEAAILTGIAVVDRASTVRAAEQLLAMGVRHVIITLGAKGAFYKSSTTELEISAPTVMAVDTTAAGDVFNGVLAVKIAEGNTWEDAINWACTAAAFSVTRMGAQASMPSKQQADEFAASIPNKKLPLL